MLLRKQFRNRLHLLSDKGLSIFSHQKIVTGSSFSLNPELFPCFSG